MAVFSTRLRIGVIRFEALAGLLSMACRRKPVHRDKTFSWRNDKSSFGVRRYMKNPFISTLKPKLTEVSVARLLKSLLQTQPPVTAGSPAMKTHPGKLKIAGTVELRIRGCPSVFESRNGHDRLERAPRRIRSRFIRFSASGTGESGEKNITG